MGDIADFMIECQLGYHEGFDGDGVYVGTHHELSSWVMNGSVKNEIKLKEHGRKAPYYRERDFGDIKKAKSLFEALSKTRNRVGLYQLNYESGKIGYRVRYTKRLKPWKRKRS